VRHGRHRGWEGGIDDQVSGSEGSAQGHTGPLRGRDGGGKRFGSLTALVLIVLVLDTCGVQHGRERVRGHLWGRTRAGQRAWQGEEVKAVFSHLGPFQLAGIRHGALDPSRSSSLCGVWKSGL
jgi:hypothetical protein